MLLSLHTSSTKTLLGAYISPVVPRSGELLEFADSGLFRVVHVCYRIVNRESDEILLEVEPANDVALRYVGEVILKGE